MAFKLKTGRRKTSVSRRKIRAAILSALAAKKKRTVAKRRA